MFSLFNDSRSSNAPLSFSPCINSSFHKACFLESLGTHNASQPERDCKLRVFQCFVSGGWWDLSGMDFLGSLCSKDSLKWAVSRRSSQVTVTHLTASVDHSSRQSPLTAAWSGCISANWTEGFCILRGFHLWDRQIIHKMNSAVYCLVKRRVRRIGIHLKLLIRKTHIFNYKWLLKPVRVQCYGTVLFSQKLWCCVKFNSEYKIVGKISTAYSIENSRHNNWNQTEWCNCFF